NMPDLLVFTAIVPKIFGSKIILDIHDVMSEVFLSKNSNSSNFLIKMLKIQERISAKFADYVLSVDEYHMKVIECHGVNIEKITVISNFPDEDLFKPIAIEDKEENLFKLIFHGTISKVYGLETVINGIFKIKGKIPGLKFIIIGEGDYESEIFDLIMVKKLQDIILFNNKKIPHEQVPEEIANADLGIVSCPDITAVYQNKFLEYISMGIPTLIEYNDMVYKFYKDYNLEFYNRNDPDSFAEKLYYLYSDRDRYNELKETTRKLAKKFKWSSEKRKYLDLVDELLN
ncbi:MAG: glycosyltransferase, partial [Actinobacteria bacterium]|nr:glycosyltransferase [Actinomycetota bacterium]